MRTFSIQTMLPKETLQAVFNTLTESVSNGGDFSEFRQQLLNNVVGLDVHLK